MKRLPVKDFLTAAQGHLVLDVRSPAEYAHACLPGALSLPLFSDAERKLVGTAYKQESREKAIKIGLDFFGPKMRGMVEAVEALLHNSQQAKPPVAEGQLPNVHSVFLYCWRGGMRSGAVAWLLNLYGFDVTVLAGGYKSFRRLCIDTLEQPYRLKVLGGYTGSGKTELLHALQSKGAAVVDLEHLANHKGSAFGKQDGGQQPSQEMFENLLACRLRSIDQEAENGGARERAIWIEDESQRIGRVQIPNGLWQTMRQSPLYFLEIDFEQRLNYLLQHYGHKDTAHLVECTQRIGKKLGGLETKNAIAFFEQGNIREAFRILLRYYDKLYSKGLHSRENLATLLHRIAAGAVTPENSLLLTTPYQTS